MEEVRFNYPSILLSRSLSLSLSLSLSVSLFPELLSKHSYASTASNPIRPLFRHLLLWSISPDTGGGKCRGEGQGGGAASGRGCYEFNACQALDTTQTDEIHYSEFLAAC